MMSTMIVFFCVVSPPNLTLKLIIWEEKVMACFQVYIFPAHKHDNEKENSRQVADRMRLSSTLTDSVQIDASPDVPISINFMLQMHVK
jgi:hypothetical protein